ncbi:MAG: RhuM family protein [Candidatus Gracilibacteria bacterium]
MALKKGKTQEVSVKYYNLDVIISVGYRVRSIQGTKFRQWATARLREYIVKGFTMDDERFKGNGGGQHWKELLDRIRDIRSSEKVGYTSNTLSKLIMFNYFLSILGFLATLAVIVGPILAVIFLVVWLAVSAEKKKRYGKLALMGLAIFFAGILGLVLTLGGFAGLNQESSESGETSSESSLTADQILIEFGLEDNTCSIEKVEDGKTIVLFSIWARTNQKVSVEQYPIEVTYDLEDGYLIGGLQFRRDGEDRGLSVPLIVNMEGSGTETLNNIAGDFNINDSVEGNDVDQILEIILTPKSGTKISEGGNTLTLTVPVEQWSIYNNGEESEATQIPSSNISTESILTTTCKF